MFNLLANGSTPGGRRMFAPWVPGSGQDATSSPISPDAPQKYEKQSVHTETRGAPLLNVLPGHGPWGSDDVAAAKCNEQEANGACMWPSSGVGVPMKWAKHCKPHSKRGICKLVISRTFCQSPHCNFGLHTFPPSLSWRIHVWRFESPSSSLIARHPHVFVFI